MRTKQYSGPCTICGTYDSKRFIKKMCKRCYQRISDTGNTDPEKKYMGPCIICGTYESSSGRFSREMCNRCYQVDAKTREPKPGNKFQGPCTVCGDEDPSGYYKKRMCNNCYRKARRRERGLKPIGLVKQYEGPCVVCGSNESSNGRFTKKMCCACYKRISRGGNYKPRTKYNGPCERCGLSDDSAKYNRKMCPRCYKWHENNILGANAKRRARLRSVENTLTPEQWKRVLKHYDYHCAYCDEDIHDCFTMDHVIPLVKGGAHAIHNVVPACLSCNSGKRDRPAPEGIVTLSA